MSFPSFSFSQSATSNAKSKLKPASSASSGLLDLRTELLRTQASIASSNEVNAPSSAKNTIKVKSTKLDPKFILPPSDSGSSHSKASKKKRDKTDRHQRSDDRKSAKRRRKSKSPEPDWDHIQATLAHKSKVYDTLVESGGGAELELARARGEVHDSGDGPLIDFVAKRYDQILSEERTRKERKKDRRKRGRRRGDSDDSDGSRSRSRSRSRSPTERHRRKRDRRDRYHRRSRSRSYSRSRSPSRSRSRSRSRTRRRDRRSRSPGETILSGLASRAIRDRYLSDAAASDAESMVEIEDEFGRTRRVPRALAHQYDPNLAQPGSDSDSSHNDDITRFFAFAPLPELPHYESTREVRTIGAGYYKLAQDDDARQAQMAELKALREETLAARKAKAAEAGLETLEVVKPVVSGLHNDPTLDPALQVDVDSNDTGPASQVASAQQQITKEPLDARLIRRIRLVMRRRIKLVGVEKARQVQWAMDVPESVYEDLFVSMANERPLCEQYDAASLDGDQ